jgi:hypothetical protein
MTLKTSYIVGLLAFGVFAFAGLNFWHYAFDLHEPVVFVNGII